MGASGGLLELVAHGAQDVFLIGNPQITFFKIVYKRHTNFSMQSIRATFDGHLDFGQKLVAELPRSGDLVHSLILEIDLPKLETNNGNQISYVNSIGHAIIDYVEVEIGGQVIDKQYGEWMEIWTQLTYADSKQFGYQSMLSKAKEGEFNTVTGPTTLYVPLQFWFCRNIGLSLPLIALQYHSIKINIQLNKLNPITGKKLYTLGLTNGSNNRYVGSQNDTLVTITSSTSIFSASDVGRIIYWSDGSTSTITGYTDSSKVVVSESDSDTKASQSFYIAVNDTLKENYALTDVRLFADYIFLDTFERKQFATMKHRYLIEQIQFSESESVGGFSNKKFKINFNLPVKAMYWICQLNDTDIASETFNFSNTVDPKTTKADPISKVSLLLNGVDRFDERNAQYFRLIQPFQKHTRVPNDFIYMYSFALYPENHQPSGTCNFSKLDSVELNLSFQTNLGASTVRIYGISYNVLRIYNGMGGVAFSN